MTPFIYKTTQLSVSEIRTRTLCPERPKSEQGHTEPKFVRFSASSENRTFGFRTFTVRTSNYQITKKSERNPVQISAKRWTIFEKFYNMKQSRLVFCPKSDLPFVPILAFSRFRPFGFRRPTVLKSFFILFNVAPLSTFVFSAQVNDKRWTFAN